MKISQSSSLLILIQLCAFYFQCSICTNFFLHPTKTVIPFVPRGGGSSVATKKKPSHVLTNDDDDEVESKLQQEKRKIQEEKEVLMKYKLQQQHLLQLRSTFLSEALAQRGIQVGPTMMDVSTPEGNKPPQEADWDCCMSTVEEPKTCLYSFDAEPNTKVICPVGTTQYISLSALNRLRRTDPSKVEPMWHSQYAIIKSWFSDESQYSLMQYVGFKGFVVSTLLLDLGQGLALKGLLAFSILALLVIFMPVIEIVVSRILTSSTLWMKWKSWGKFVHAALPLKILIGQMIWKFLAGSFGKLENLVREQIVDLECAILEDSIPITIGGTDDAVSNEESDDDDDDDYESDEE